MIIYKSKLVIEIEFVTDRVPTQEDAQRITRMIDAHVPLDIVKECPKVTITSEKVEI